MCLYAGEIPSEGVVWRIAALATGFEGLKERIHPLFWSQMGGSIGEVDKKNAWQLAGHAGDPAPRRMQGLLGRTIWGRERARDIYQDFVIEGLGNACTLAKLA